MLIYSLILLLSNAVTSKRDKSILFSRVAILILLYSTFLAYNDLDMSFLEKGIGLYGGLFHATSTTQIFHLFIFLLSAIILSLTAFYPLLALSLVITLFSFVGLSPLTGFFVNHLILSATLDNGYVLMALIVLFTSVISTVYYLTVIKHIFFVKTLYSTLFLTLYALVLLFIPVTHLLIIKYYGGDLITNIYTYTSSELLHCYYYTITEMQCYEIILIISYYFTILCTKYNLYLSLKKKEKYNLKQKIQQFKKQLELVFEYVINNIGKLTVIILILRGLWIFILNIASSVLGVEMSDQIWFSYLFILLSTLPVIILLIRILIWFLFYKEIFIFDFYKDINLKNVCFVGFFSWLNCTYLSLWIEQHTAWIISLVNNLFSNKQFISILNNILSLHPITRNFYISPKINTNSILYTINTVDLHNNAKTSLAFTYLKSTYKCNIIINTKNNYNVRFIYSKTLSLLNNKLIFIVKSPLQEIKIIQINMNSHSLNKYFYKLHTIFSKYNILEINHNKISNISNKVYMCNTKNIIINHNIVNSSLDNKMINIILDYKIFFKEINKLNIYKNKLDFLNKNELGVLNKKWLTEFKPSDKLWAEIPTISFPEPLKGLSHSNINIFSNKAELQCNKYSTSLNQFTSEILSIGINESQKDFSEVSRLFYDPDFRPNNANIVYIYNGTGTDPNLINRFDSNYNRLTGLIERVEREWPLFLSYTRHLRRVGGVEMIADPVTGGIFVDVPHDAPPEIDSQARTLNNRHLTLMGYFKDISDLIARNRFIAGQINLTDPTFIADDVVLIERLTPILEQTYRTYTIQDFNERVNETLNSLKTSHQRDLPLNATASGSGSGSASKRDRDDSFDDCDNSLSSKFKQMKFE